MLLELHDPQQNNSRFVESIACQVGTWAEEAFRTMVFGYKSVDASAFREWLAAYDTASADPEQKELRKQKKPNALDRLEFEMENGLVLQGATAIEDSLQEGVPEALAQLSDAGHPRVDDNGRQGGNGEEHRGGVQPAEASGDEVGGVHEGGSGRNITEQGGACGGPDGEDFTVGTRRVCEVGRRFRTWSGR